MRRKKKITKKAPKKAPALAVTPEEESRPPTAEEKAAAYFARISEEKAADYKERTILAEARSWPWASVLLYMAEDLGEESTISARHLRRWAAIGLWRLALALLLERSAMFGGPEVLLALADAIRIDAEERGLGNEHTRAIWEAALREDKEAVDAAHHELFLWERSEEGRDVGEGSLWTALSTFAGGRAMALEGLTGWPGSIDLIRRWTILATSHVEEEGALALGALFRKLCKVATVALRAHRPLWAHLLEDVEGCEYAALPELDPTIPSGPTWDWPAKRHGGGLGARVRINTRLPVAEAWRRWDLYTDTAAAQVDLCPPLDSGFWTRDRRRELGAKLQELLAGTYDEEISELRGLRMADLALEGLEGNLASYRAERVA